MNDVSDSIGWADCTWTPVTGCRNNCVFNGVPCYAAAMAKRFKRSFAPAFHRDRLGEPAKVIHRLRIFVGSTTDFGSPGVRPEWVKAVVDAARSARWHRYLMLTKRPERLPGFLRLEPWWIGVSVTRPSDLERIWRLAEWAGSKAKCHLWASFEPLLAPIDLPPELAVHLKWIVCGALTRGRTVPAKRGGTWSAWALELAAAARDYGIPLYEKDNLRPLLGEHLHQAWPEGLE